MDEKKIDKRYIKSLLDLENRVHNMIRVEIEETLNGNSNRDIFKRHLNKILTESFWEDNVK